MSTKKIDEKLREMREIREIDQLRKVEKKQNQVAMAVYAALTVAAIVVAIVIFYLLNQPFTTTIYVYGWEGKNHYPLEGKGAIELTLGDKTERAAINSNGEAIFTQVLPKFKGKRVPVKIVDTGYNPFYLADSMILIRKNELCDIQVLLRGLEKLEGAVVDENGYGIVDAAVWVAGISTQTDGRGYFQIDIPLDKQRLRQEVEILKDGYAPYRNIDIPMAGGDGCRIVLHPQ